VEQLSLVDARRIALAAQGFGARPDKVTAARWRKTLDGLSLHEIDSDNILVRAHYMRLLEPPREGSEGGRNTSFHREGKWASTPRADRKMILLHLHRTH
jgi:hypothetical protein